MSLLPPARKLSLACLALTVSMAASAHADGRDAQQRRRAAALYDQAVKLYESGKYAAAARAFFDADELAPSSDALSSAIASARLAHDDLLVAHAAQRAVAREASDPKLAGDARAALSEAETHLSRVDFSCQPEPCSLSIEDADVQRGRHYLLPGTRVFRATFGAEQVEQRSALAAGSLYTITLSPAPAPAPVPKAVAAPPAPPARPAPPKPHKPLPAWSFYAAAGTTLVLAGVTTWSGVDALGDVDQYKSTRRAPDRDTAESSVRRTDILLVGTLVLGGLTTLAGLRWVSFGAEADATGAVVTWSGKL
jgi:hypothetical protein